MFSFLILDIDDGTYYSRKAGSDEVTKHVIKDGKAVLSDAIYGHEYEFNTRDELKTAIEEYIDYYNNRRIQVNLKGLTPCEAR